MVIPLFQEAELVKAMPFIVVSMLLGLGRECFCLMEGRYTRRLFMVTAVTDLLSLICWAIALWGYSIFNPEFSARITAIFPDLIEISWVFNGLPQVFMAVLIFAHLLDSGVTAFRAWKYQKT